MDEARLRRIRGWAIAAAIASVIVMVACILFVALGGMRLFLSAARAPAWEETLLEQHPPEPLPDAGDGG